MSDATIVAQEIQDLASTVGEVAAALRTPHEQNVTVNVPEQPAPVVHVNVPEPAPLAPPQVTVNVPAQAAPVVNVAAPDVKPQIIFPPHLPSAYDVVVTERDSNGFIKRFTITPA